MVAKVSRIVKAIKQYRFYSKIKTKSKTAWHESIDIIKLGIFMAYWVYNMGLPIAVKHDVLVQKKNIKAIDSAKGEKRILDTDHPTASAF